MLSGIATVQSGFPFHANSGIQSVERWRFAQSGAAFVESGIQRECDSRWPEQIFRSNCVCHTAKRHIRKRRARYSDRAGPFGAGSIACEGYFPIRENKNFEFRAEFFNVLNHTNFGSPKSRGLCSGIFGSVDTAGSD